MLASSRGFFFDVVLNPASPQGWSDVPFASSAQFSNPAAETESNNVPDEEAASPENTHVASEPSHAEPKSRTSLASADPRSSRPAASVNLVKETKSHNTVAAVPSSEYKIGSGLPSNSIGGTESKTVNTDGKLGILVGLVQVY